MRCPNLCLFIPLAVERGRRDVMLPFARLIDGLSSPIADLHYSMRGGKCRLQCVRQLGRGTRMVGVAGVESDRPTSVLIPVSTGPAPHGSSTPTRRREDRDSWRLAPARLRHIISASGLTSHDVPRVFQQTLAKGNPVPSWHASSEGAWAGPRMANQYMSKTRSGMFFCLQEGS